MSFIKFQNIAKSHTIFNFSTPTCGGLGLEIGCALVTGSLWDVVTPPLSPAPGKEKDDVDETAGDVTPGRTLVLQMRDTGVGTNKSYK